MSWTALSCERGTKRAPSNAAKLFEIDFEGAPTRTPELPRALNTLPPVAEATVTRVLKLEEGTVARNGHQGHSGSETQGPVFSINGQIFPNVEPLKGTLGTIEQWTIANVSMMDHPFHLHGFRFEVIDINGSAPAYRALQYTINVAVGEVVTLRVPLQGYAGTWMFHCHILEHTERGMMGELDVSEP